MEIEQSENLDSYQPIKNCENNGRMIAKQLHQQRKPCGKRAFGVDITNRKLPMNVNASGEFDTVAKPTLHESVTTGYGGHHRAQKHQPQKNEAANLLLIESDLAPPQHFDENHDIKYDDGDASMRDLTAVEDVTPQPWDLEHTDDDLHVTPYVDSIIASLRANECDERLECVLQNNEDYMLNQTDITPRMRTVLVDWLLEVHRKFHLLPRTFYLAVNILDRYLAHESVHRSQLQLTGCCCLWIASKYHELYSPEMEDFVYIADNAFTHQELISAEVSILKSVRFTLTVPTVIAFAERYATISAFYLKKEHEKKIIADLIMCCCEHAIANYELCRLYPSKLAAAAFMYASLTTKVFSLERMREDRLEQVVGYTVEQLLPTLQSLHNILKNAKKSKQKAVYKKYCASKYSNVSKLNFNKLYTEFLHV
jgi:cyclin B